MSSASGFEDPNPLPPTAELIDHRYRLIEKIGSGGMATVFLAADERLGRRVAIKRLGTEGPEDASRRLLQEAKLGATLNHPNIVSVYDAVPDPRSGAVLIVMELVDGPDLGRDLRSGPLDEQRALEILDDMASALDHVHEHGIVHRDVKPSNVLLAPRRAKLTDLGIAKALEDTGITRSGVILGSVPYMSPEQLSGKPAGPESDLYSLALIAYELLSGERAHTGENPLRVTHEALHEPPPDLSAVRPEIPAAAARVIARALDPDPTRRPMSACSFVRELERGLEAKEHMAEDSPTETAPVPVPWGAGEADSAQAASARPSPAERVRSETFRPPAEPPSTAADDHRFPWLVALAGLAIAGVVAAILLLDGGSGGPGADSSGDRRADVQEGEAGASPEPEATGGAAATQVPATGTGGEPAASVETFYTEAANGDFDVAFAAATPNLQAQLGGTAQFETLESVEFRSIETTSETSDSASVSFETLATHTDRVEACSGTATVVLDGDSWLLDSIDGVDCRPV